MPTTTRVALLQRLSEAMGQWWSAATTGAGTTTTTVDSKLAQLGEDDFCLRWYVRKVATDEVRQVTGGYLAVTNTITHAAFPAAIGNANTYELHREDPRDKHLAILRAIEQLFPSLYLSLRDETLVVDDILANSDFESAISAGAHPSWTNVGAGITVTADTARLVHGAQANKIVAGAGAAGQTTQAPTVNINEVTGKTATLKAWVYATAADIARIRLDWDGTAFANHAYHGANDQWELQTLTATVPATATQVKAICEVAAGGTAFFDAMSLTITPVYRYTIPSAMIYGPHYVTQQYYEAQPDGPYYPVMGNPTAGRRLRLEGMGLLSRPTTDAGTLEVGPPQTELILAQARYWLNSMTMYKAAMDQRERYRQNAEDALLEVQRLRVGPAIRMPLRGAAGGNGAWNIQEDSAGRYLTFLKTRS